MTLTKSDLEKVKKIVKEEVEKSRENLSRFGMSWDEAEDEQLKQEFDSAINEIAFAHKRGVLAIQYRIVKLLKDGEITLPRLEL